MKNIKTAEEILSGRFNTTPELLEHTAHCRISSCLLAMEEHANQFKPEWVSVEERLPEECVHVIIYGRYTSDSPMKANQALYVPKKRKFYQEGVISKNVTHWMPLPNSPQVLTDK